MLAAALSLDGLVWKLRKTCHLRYFRRTNRRHHSRGDKSPGRSVHGDDIHALLSRRMAAESLLRRQHGFFIPTHHAKRREHILNGVDELPYAEKPKAECEPNSWSHRVPI